MQKFLRTLMLVALMAVPFASQAQADCTSPQQIPYGENFDGYTGVATGTSAPTGYPAITLPSCWEFLNMSSTTTTYPQAFLSSSTTYAYSGNCLFFKSSSTTPLYALMPSMATSANEAYELTFYYRNEGITTSNGTIIVGVMSDATDATTFVALDTLERTTTKTLVELILPAGTLTSGSRVVFCYVGSSNNYYASIDQVSLHAAPTCFKVSDLAINEELTTANSLTLTWNDALNANASYLIYDMSDTSVVGFNVTGNSYTVTGLSSNTVYTFAIISNCGDADITEFSGSATGRTACDATTALPYAENFSGYTGLPSSPYYGPAVTPACWDYYSNGTNTAETTGTSSYYGGVSIYGYTSSYASMVANDPYLCLPIQITAESVTSETYRNYEVQRGNTKIAILPAFDQPLTGLQISFDYKMSTAYSETAAATTLELGYVEGTDVTSFVTIASYPAVTTLQHVAELNLSTLGQVPSNARLAFRFSGVHNGTSTYSYSTVYAGIDNIVVEEIPSCFHVTGLTITDVTSESITLSWNDSINGNALYNIFMDGQLVITNVDGNSYTIVNLDPNTEYTFSVVTNCGSELSEAETVTARTACGAFAVPYTWDFEDMSTSAAPLCWTKLTGGTANVMSGSSDVHYHSATKYVQFQGIAGNNILVLPETEDEISTLQLRFWTRPESVTNANCGTFSVGYMIDTTFVAMATYTYSDFTAYEERTVTFGGAPAGARMAMRHDALTSGWYWRVDDVTIEEAPSCVPPTAIAMEYIGGNTNAATITWTSNASSFNLELNGVVTYGFATSSPATITGLDANTLYTIKIQADCGDGDTSEWSDAVSMRTPCGMITTLPWNDGMEAVPAGSNQMPYCWSRYNNLASDYNYYPYSTSSSSYVHEGSRALYFYMATSSTYADTAVAILPQLDVTTYPMSGNQLRFFARTGSATASIDVIVGSMSDPEDINTFVASDSVTVSGNVHSRYEVDLTNAGSNDAYAAIMVLKPSSSVSLYIDDVTLMEIPTCFPPVMNEVTWEPNEYYDDRFYATVSWESTGDNNSYEIRILEDDEEDTITNGFSTDKRFSVAVFNTIVVWVRSICGAGDTSEWSAPVTLYKGYCEPNPTSVDGQGITGVSFGGMTNNATHPTSAPFYGNYSQMAGSVPVGTTASVDITYSTGATTVYSYGTIIWVDWNKDYVFDDEEIVYTGMSAQGSGGVPEVLHATFDIPATQALGNYRMRIAGADSYFDSYVNTGSGNHSPCFSSTYAVAEDYTLTVTEVPVCAVPANLAANYANGTIELSWSSEATAFNLSVNGTVTNVTGTTATITDLEPNTTYTVMVQSVCGPADTSDWSTAVSITTPCNAISLPFTENFDPTTSATISCWSKVDCNSQTMVYGDVFRFYYTTNPPQYLISPELNPINGTMNVSFDYWVEQSSYPESFALGYSTTTNNSTDFTWLTEQTNLTNTAALNYSEELPAGVKYVAIKYTANNQYALYIDNVVFAPTAAPVPDSVTITFAVNDATMGSIEPMGTHTYVAGEVLTVTATPAEGYHLYAWSLTTEDTTVIDTEDIELSRADTIISEMDGAIITAIFEADPSTGCNAVALPFVETFEETSATRECWNLVSNNEANVGGYNGMGFVTLNNSEMLRFSSYTTASDYNQYGFSPVWTVPANAASLNVKVRYATYGNGDNLYFGYISGNDTVWGNTAYSTTGQSDFQYYEAPLPATATQLAVHYYGNYSYYAWIDSVTVTASEAQPCFAINNMAVTDVTLNSVTVEWTGDAASYDVEALMGDNVVYTNNVTTTTATINGLTAETAYTVRVRSNCGTDNVSAWTVANAFTGYCVPTPTSVDGSGITSVSFGGMTNTTSHAGSSAAYVNNSTMAGSVPAGTNATVDITYATGYTYGTLIWVDWNNNMLFEGNEVVFAGASTDANPTTLTATFNIPATTATGDYRMRILGADSYFDSYIGSLEAAANANPCATSYSYGVAEDYTLTVTEAPSCLAPADVAIEYIGGNNNAATITWTSNASSFNLDVNGVVTYGFATSSPATITGLDANTEYIVKIQANCGNGDVSEWTLPVSMRTPCGMITELPWSDGMEAVPEGNYEMPYCWSRYNNLASDYNYYPYSTSSTYYAHEGSRSLYWSFSTYGIYPDTAVAILPQLDVTTYPMSGNQLSFYARMSSATASINVIVGSMSDPEDINTFVASDSVTVSGNVHNRYDVNLTSAGLNDAYAAIMVLKPSSSAYLYVDDVTLHEIPSCSYVTGVVVDSVTAESVTISWQDLANQGASYSIYNGDELVASNINATTYTVGNLTANTDYTIGVVANCPAGDAEMITVVAHTACSAMELPYTEDFSATTGTRDCWTLVSNNTVNASTSSTSNNYMGFVSYSGHDVMVFNSWSTASDYFQYGYSPLLDATALEGSDSLHVRVVYSTYGSDDPVYYGYTTTGSTNPSDYTWVGPFYTNGYDDWTVFEVNLPMTANRLAVNYASTTCSYKAYIDSLVVTGYTTPVVPDSVTMTFAVNDVTMGTINPMGTHTYAVGDSLVVTATANEGYHLNGWHIEIPMLYVDTVVDAAFPPYADIVSAVMNGAAFTAIFAANDTTVTADTLILVLDLNDATLGSITPAPGTYKVPLGDSITIVATPNEGNVFNGWLFIADGDTVATIPIDSMALSATPSNVNHTMQMIAMFATSGAAPDSVTFVINTADATMGTTMPAPGTYRYAIGDTAFVHAIPAEGYHNLYWVSSITAMGVTMSDTVAEDSLSMVISQWFANATFTLTAYFEADSTPVTPVVPEATIAASEILYWVGEGNNEVVMAVNWADTALAWGYRFSEDSVTVATMMADIAAADPRFSYDGYPYINNIFFTENGTTLQGDTNSYWGSKNNGIMDAGMYQYLHNGDFEKWANTAAGVVVDSIYYEGWGWDYIYNYPMTIHPVSVPCINTYDTIAVAACDSYVWLGDTLTQSGLYTHIYENVGGCDSVVVLDLTVNYSVSVAVSDSVEGSYEWHNNIYVESGVYTWTGSTVANCDSTVTLTLTISNPCTPVYADTAVAIACDSYEWNNQYYYQSGLYVHMIDNPSGCDTVVSLDLTINYSVVNEIIMTAVDSLVWHDSIYTESGVYSWHGTTINSCDSLVVLYLTIVPDSVTVTFNVNDATMGSINPSGVVTYAVGDLLTVTATANEGYYLAGWMLTLDTVSETLTENVPLTYSNTVIAEIDGLIITALFAADTTPVQPETVTVTFNVNDASMGTITPSGTQTFQVGDVVTITATSNENYRLAAWQISVGGRTETISEDIELSYTATVESAWNGGVVTAIFELITGIEDVEGNNAEIYSVDNRIVVKGVENMNVYVYDVNGRCVNTQVNAAETVEFTMNASGVYLVKVGNAPAKRVAVVR